MAEHKFKQAGVCVEGTLCHPTKQTLSPHTHAHKHKHTYAPTHNYLHMQRSQTSKDRYDQLKIYTTQTKPIPTQCVVVKTILNEKRRMTVATKVCLQMAAKMGGELWTVESLPPETMVSLCVFGVREAIELSKETNKTIKKQVVGIDVNHDSELRGESIMALVASFNSSFTRYTPDLVFFF